MSQKFLILFLLTTTHSVHSMEIVDQDYSTTVTDTSTTQPRTLTWVPLPTTGNTVTTSGNQSLAKRRTKKTMSLTDCPPSGRSRNTKTRTGPGDSSKRDASSSPQTTPVVEELSPVSQTLQEKIDTLRKQTAILEKEMDKRKALHHGTAPKSTTVSTTLSTFTREQATTRIEKYVYTTSSSPKDHRSLSKSSQPAATPSTPSFDFSDLGLLQGTGTISSLGSLFNSAHGGLQKTNYYSSSQQQPPLTRSRSSQLLAAAAAVTASNSNNKDKDSTFDLQFNENFDFNTTFDFNFYQDINKNSSSQPVPRLTRSMSSQLLAAAAAVTASNSDKNSTFDLQSNENFDPFDFNFYQDTNQDNSSQPAPRLTRSMSSQLRAAAAAVTASNSNNEDKDSTSDLQSNENFDPFDFNFYQDTNQDNSSQPAPRLTRSMSSQLRAAAAAATASNSNQKCNKRKDSSKSDQDYNSSDSDESVSTEQDINSEDEESRTKLTRRKNKIQTKSQGASSVAPSLDEDIKNAEEQIKKLSAIYTSPEQQRVLKFMSKGLTKKVYFKIPQYMIDKKCKECGYSSKKDSNILRHFNFKHLKPIECPFDIDKKPLNYHDLGLHLKTHSDLTAIFEVLRKTNHNVSSQRFIIGNSQ